MGKVGITMGHEYLFDGAKWKMLNCGCSNTAPVCNFPNSLPRGTKFNEYRKLQDGDDEKLTEQEQFKKDWNAGRR